MNPSKSSEEAPPVSLVGSLSVFTLSDVLSLLASTSQTGEVRVVTDQVDGRLWLSDGYLSNAHVGAAATIGQAVFELASGTGGWLHFTAGTFSSSGQPAVPVPAVLDEVRPQVEEWREIRKVIPLEAVVTLSPDSPGHDVQIRSDQWPVLTTVGNSGQTVKAVLDQIGGDKIMSLRTLRDLHAAGLIALIPAAWNGSPAQEGLPPTATEHQAETPPLPPPPPAGLPPQYASYAAQTAPPPPGSDPAGGHDDARLGGLADVALMSPPMAADPWAATVEPDDSRHNGVA
jgi:Domain of unknown function (DUF4388)